MKPLSILLVSIVIMQLSEPGTSLEYLRHKLRIKKLTKLALAARLLLPRFIPIPIPIIRHEKEHKDYGDDDDGPWKSGWNFGGGFNFDEGGSSFGGGEKYLVKEFDGSGGNDYSGSQGYGGDSEKYFVKEIDNGPGFGGYGGFSGADHGFTDGGWSFAGMGFHGMPDTGPEMPEQFIIKEFEGSNHGGGLQTSSSNHGGSGGDNGGTEEKIVVKEVSGGHGGESTFSTSGWTPVSGHSSNADKTEKFIINEIDNSKNGGHGSGWDDKDIQKAFEAHDSQLKNEGKFETKSASDKVVVKEVSDKKEQDHIEKMFDVSQVELREIREGPPNRANGPTWDVINAPLPWDKNKKQISINSKTAGWPRIVTSKNWK